MHANEESRRLERIARISRTIESMAAMQYAALMFAVATGAIAFGSFGFDAGLLFLWAFGLAIMGAPIAATAYFAWFFVGWTKTGRTFWLRAAGAGAVSTLVGHGALAGFGFWRHAPESPDDLPARIGEIPAAFIYSLATIGPLTLPIGVVAALVFARAIAPRLRRRIAERVRSSA